MGPLMQELIDTLAAAIAEAREALEDLGLGSGAGPGAQREVAGGPRRGPRSGIPDENPPGDSLWTSPGPDADPTRFRGANLPP